MSEMKREIKVVEIDGAKQFRDFRGHLRDINKPLEAWPDLSSVSFDGYKTLHAFTHDTLQQVTVLKAKVKTKDVRIADLERIDLRRCKETEELKTEALCNNCGGILLACNGKLEVRVEELEAELGFERGLNKASGSGRLQEICDEAIIARDRHYKSWKKERAAHEETKNLVQQYSEIRDRFRDRTHRAEKRLAAAERRGLERAVECVGNLSEGWAQRAKGDDYIETKVRSDARARALDFAATKIRALGPESHVAFPEWCPKCEWLKPSGSCGYVCYSDPIVQTPPTQFRQKEERTCATCGDGRGMVAGLKSVTGARLYQCDARASTFSGTKTFVEKQENAACWHKKEAAE